MNVRPLGDRIVVRRAAAEEKTSGGILLPDSAKNKPQRGEVLATGPGRLLKDGSRGSLQVKTGDNVLFTAWAGDEFKQQGSDDPMLIMREEDVLAVLEPFNEAGMEEEKPKDRVVERLWKILMGAVVPKASPLYDRRTKLIGRRPDVSADEIRGLIKDVESETGKKLFP
jgi:chaperonin GroES